VNKPGNLQKIHKNLQAAYTKTDNPNNVLKKLVSSLCDMIKTLILFLQKLDICIKESVNFCLETWKLTANQ